jgi:general secretion pathway protein G
VGFTLIELMVVIVIIGILAGVVVGYYGGSTQKAYEVRVKADFRLIEDCIERFKLDTSIYPENLEELMLGEGIDGWGGPYLKRPPLDPWDVPYIYELSGEGSFPYEIKTLGSDGTEGGEEEKKDYSNLDVFKEGGFGQ